MHHALLGGIFLAMGEAVMVVATGCAVSYERLLSNVDSG
jgi:hypothetical protein